MVNDRVLVALLAAACVGLFASVDVSAGRRGIVIINTDEDVMKIATVPSAIQTELRLPLGSAVGVKYSRVGLFWLDILRWDSQLCLFNRTSDGFEYELATAAELAAIAGIPESEITVPLRYHVPPGGVILGLLVVVGGPIMVRRILAADKRRTALLADPRYAAVVQAFNANHKTNYDDRLQQAVDSLVEQGIPVQQAHDDLRVLVGEK